MAQRQLTEEELVFAWFQRLVWSQRFVVHEKSGTVYVENNLLRKPVKSQQSVGCHSQKTYEGRADVLLDLIRDSGLSSERQLSTMQNNQCKYTH